MSQKNLTYSPSIYQFYINNSEKNTSELFFKDNTITTRKYNIITFLPKSLLIQFMRPANIYFLVIAIIQFISIISPLSPISAIAPLIIVLTVSLIREGIEDFQKAKMDHQQNSEKIEVFREGMWTTTTSGDLKMGEIIEVKKDCTFPCDLVLLGSDLREGVCYIETGTLDGEKTLKLKEPPDYTKYKFISDNYIGVNYSSDSYADTFNNDISFSNNNNNENGSFKKKNKDDRKDIQSDNKSFNSKKGIKDKIEYFCIEGNGICDLPNPNLYQLNGKMNFMFNGDVTEFPIESKNLLLKGAKLRNTHWIVGIVIYTGHNCKIMKNSKDVIVKFSSVELLMNKLIYFIFFFQLILSIISAIIHKSLYIKNQDLILQDDTIDENEIGRNYIDYLDYKLSIETFLSFFTYFLLLNTLIPISLIITLEMVKFIQGIFIGIDVQGYSFIRKKFIKPQSISLNEELGMIDYIFSDKTGTLTCNKMLLKFCVIGDICFEFIRNDYEVNEKLRRKEKIIPFENYDMINASSSKNGNGIFDSTQYDYYIVKSDENPNCCIYLDRSEKIIEEYWKALAICHDCRIQDGEYLAMSPDNLELVKSASLQGFKYDENDNINEIVIILGDEKGTKKKILQKLQRIEFSSERKRESIIVKEGDIIKLYMKGADNVIEERLNLESQPKIVLNKAKYYVNLFSGKGYRTLFIAMKVLTQREYDTFSINLEKAKMDTKNKKKLVEECYDSIEKNLTLIGATIVEDKLQDEVPEVIEDLRKAGIKIWMLTGDKMNTAYNIGLSCNLISSDMKIFFVQGKDVKKNERLEDINKYEREKVVYTFIKEFKKFKGNYDSMQKPIFGIIIDEKGLFTLTENAEMTKMFLSVAKDAVSVICCRVSPIQKSQVVKMIKNYNKNKKTLAIGDGGNDVSMIMEAHIGIGIYGEEGLRAAQSSDYAIGEFKILRRLLLFHGYVNLMRNSEMIIYFFYKNFVFTIIHFFFGFYNNFSGQTIIDDWFITLFNLVFTSIPLGVKGITDIDLNPDDGKIIFQMLPYLYLEGRDYPKFSVFNFGLGLTKGIFHCLINYYISISIIKSSIDKNGNYGDIWFNSVNLYTNMLIIVTIDLIVHTKYNTYLNFGLIFGTTILLYAIFIAVVERLTLFNSVGTMDVAFKSNKIYLNFLLVGGIVFILELLTLSYETLLVESVRNYVKLLSEEEKNDENVNPKLIEYIENLGKSENEKIEILKEKEKMKEEERRKEEERENELQRELEFLENQNLQNMNFNNETNKIIEKKDKRRKRGEIYQNITYFNDYDNDNISSSRELKKTKPSFRKNFSINNNYNNTGNFNMNNNENQTKNNMKDYNDEILNLNDNKSKNKEEIKSIELNSNKENISIKQINELPNSINITPKLENISFQDQQFYNNEGLNQIPDDIDNNDNYENSPNL